MMTPLALARTKPRGVRWLTLCGVIASGCSEPYQQEDQFWPTDGSGTGGGFSQGTGGSGASGSPAVASGGSGTGGIPASTSGGTFGTGGATSQTTGGTEGGFSQGTGGSGASGSPAVTSGGSGTGGIPASTNGGTFGTGGATSQTTGGTSSGGNSVSGGKGGSGGSSGGSGGRGGSSSSGGSTGGSASSLNCSLSVKVTTAAAGGRYAPKNIGAIWVADQSGNFVRSLEVWAQQRVNHLTMWNSATSKAGAAGSRVDIVSQATLPNHKAHTATWNCQDFKKVAVPDGTYRVYFEMSDQAGNGPNRFETFTKGPAAVTLNPADNNNFKAMELSFKP